MGAFYFIQDSSAVCTTSAASESQQVTLDQVCHSLASRQRARPTLIASFRQQRATYSVPSSVPFSVHSVTSFVQEHRQGLILNRQVSQQLFVK